MRRKAQIFLIMTILTVSFLIAISTVLFDLKKAEFVEPSPDSDEVFEVWENTVLAIKQILVIEIAVNTQADAIDGTYDADLTPQFQILEDYLVSRGFAASITINGNSQYTAPALGGQLVTVQLDVDVNLYLSSISGITIEQILSFSIAFTANVDVTNILTVYESTNGKLTYQGGCSLTGGASTDFGNGSYDLTSAGTPYVVETPDNIKLEVDSN
ncbi:MAG: hypothetical protein ACXAD7_07805 [Candidatus Kariarchaeaceae archaeon]|jgi:hypothetical protein